MYSFVSVRSPLGVPPHSRVHSHVLQGHHFADLAIRHVVLVAKLQKLFDVQLPNFLIDSASLFSFFALAFLQSILSLRFLLELPMKSLYIFVRSHALFCE